ncbi:MAG: ABC transporter permease [Acidimicrobiales bacterium]
MADLRPRRVLRGGGVWIALMGAIAVGVLVAPGVVEPGHLPVVARRAAPLGLLALGQTILILGRGFDLSVGGVVALVNVLAAGLFDGEGNALAVAGICLGAGVAVGAANGAGIVYGRIPALVMTLGMAFLLTGAVLAYTGGTPSGAVPEGIRALSSTRLTGIPLSVFIWAGLTVLLAIVLRGTWIGRHIYARGVNPEAARLAGVRTQTVEFGSYVACGALAATGGLLLAGFVGTGTLGAGQDLMLGSLAAVVVGGTTFEGGRGGVVGSAAGAFLLTLVGALLTGADVGKAGNLIAQGVVILAAAALFRTHRDQGR